MKPVVTGLRARSGRLSRLAPLLLLLATLPATAGSPGATLKETPLKDKPFADAATLANLPAKAAVDVLGRQGGWLRVTASGKQGWVRMLNVRTGPPGQASAGREVQGVAAVASGRAGKGNIVATSGIRGLSEEELKAAKPNPAEFRKLDGYAVSEEKAREYAGRSGLVARSVPYLQPGSAEIIEKEVPP